MDQRTTVSPSFSALANRFVSVMESSLRGADQMLGYTGKDRFVVLYYEPRGEEVMWHDSHSYGFATGAWEIFMDNIAPVAELYNVDVGTGGSCGKHALLIDRHEKRAYFADRVEALRFVRTVMTPGGEADLSHVQWSGKKSGPAMEITHDAIMKLAYDLWTKQGRPEGRDMQNWLEAEAALKRS